ncbi:POC1 centriolar protein A [Nowakowskiella sp. JEL0407]|nr:POC1 centriolar protein A [Nowakowskiella sp. JEL0407]
MVNIVDDKSLQIRLQTVEDKGDKHKFIVKITPKTPIASSTNFGQTSTGLFSPIASGADWNFQSFDVMLSYKYAGFHREKRISKIYIQKSGFKVWMDLDEMKKNIFEEMARGVLSSRVIIPCVSLMYAKSENCKRELFYSAEIKKSFVPVHLQDISNIHGVFALETVKLILAGALYLDLSQLNWSIPELVQIEMDTLTKRINHRLTSSAKISDHPISSGSLTAAECVKNWLNPIEMNDELSRLESEYVKGTRLWLVAEVKRWIEISENRVLWLNGGAGVGKSMMAYLISAKLPSDWFGAIFFCRHNDSNKCNPLNVLKTIAFALSTKYPEYLDYLFNLRAKDENLLKNGKDSILNSSISSLYVYLLVNGLRMITSTKYLVIVIDALDECGKPGQSERAEILSIVSEAASVLPSFVKLIVTSRPEPDIWKSLYDINAQILEPTSDLNMEDLRIFSRSRVSCLELLSSEEINRASDALAVKSEGVFVYARLAVDNIESEQPKDFSTLMKCIDRLHNGMDSIYNSIFETSHSPDIMLVICTICSLCRPLTTSGISKLLQISEARVGGAHIALRSILRTEKDGKIAVIHKSLKDFVTSAGRASHVDFTSLNIETKLAGCCFRVLQSELKFNNANIEKSYFYTWHDVIPNYAFRATAIADHLRYASVYAISHLQNITNDSLSTDRIIELHGMISEILKTKLHFWMELLSILDQFAHIIPITVALKTFYESLKLNPKLKNSSSFGLTKLLWKSKTPEGLIPDLPLVLDLLSDSQRVCWQFGTPISRCAMQVHWTAIPFSPLNSTFHRTFSPLRPPGEYPALLPTEAIAQQWSTCLSTGDTHMDVVNSVAISRDERMMVSGSGDTTVKIWNLNTGKEIRTLSGHLKPVNAVAICNERLIVSGSRDKTLKFWYASTGKEIRTCVGHSGSINSVAICEEKGLVVSGSSDRTLKIWEMETGVNILTLSGHMGEVTSVAISSDGKLVVSGSHDNTVKLWNADTGKEIRTMMCHRKFVRAVVISLEGNIIVSGSEDKTLKIWSLSTGEELRTLIERSEVVAVALSIDGNVFVVGSNDNTVKMWDMSSGKLIRTLIGHTSRIRSVCMNNMGNLIASGSNDKSVKIWNTNVQEDTRTLHGHTHEVRCVAISHDRNVIVSGSDDKSLRIWNTKTGKEIRTLTGHSSNVTAVSISENGILMVSGSADKTVKIWNINTGKILRTCVGHFDEVRGVAISENANIVVSGSNDRTVKVWDLTSGQEIYSFAGHETWVRAVSISIDGKTIKSVDQANGELYWSMENGSCTTGVGSEFVIKRHEYILASSGWVTKSGVQLFWIPSQFRGMKFCSSKTRLVIFASVVDGHASAVFIDVSDFAKF